MSISGAALILVTVVIRAAAIDRLPKGTFLALWGIALCRLLLPFSIPSPLIAIQEINKEYQQRKTNQRNLMEGSARMPEQSPAEAEVKT